MERVGNEVVEEIGNVNMFSDEEELKLGLNFHSFYIQDQKIYNDPIVENYINTLGQTLVRYSNRRNIRYTFTVIDTNIVNAYAAPGGYIYINIGLIRKANTESQLASVIGHEIGHVVGRHGMKQMTQRYGVDYLKETILGKDTAKVSNEIYKIATDLLLLRYSREHERYADSIGVQILYDAGINPQGAVQFWEIMQGMGKREYTTVEKMLSTHPIHSERIEYISSQINTLPKKQGLRSNSTEFQRVKQRIR
ncbi:M48 family metalloprotease [Candidatus Poribacteria bacterium]|nr:M48 family metalloprotease [Candidatus Poribacteria bacterium]